MTRDERHPEAERNDLQALAALPVRDVRDEVNARVLRVTRRAFEREHAEGRPLWLSPAAQAWSRFGVPALLAGAAALYLVWAFTFTLYP